MIKASRWMVCVLVMLSTLAARSSYKPQTGELGDMSRDEFMYSLRWKRFGVAASLMQEDFREDFKLTFERVPDIHITDVRLIDQRNEAEGRRFTVTIEMDYYILPSVSVKTFRFDQTWVYFAGEEHKQQGFLITTPFPRFP